MPSSNTRAQAGLTPYHDNSLRIDGLGDDVTVVRDVFYHLVESRSLHLLELQVAEGVGDEVEKHAALPQLLDEKLFAFVRRSIWKRKQGCLSLEVGRAPTWLVQRWLPSDSSPTVTGGAGQSTRQACRLPREQPKGEGPRWQRPCTNGILLLVFCHWRLCCEGQPGKHTPRLQNEC